jgi:hypothetical protein
LILLKINLICHRDLGVDRGRTCAGFSSGSALPTIKLAPIFLRVHDDLHPPSRRLLARINTVTFIIFLAAQRKDYWIIIDPDTGKKILQSVTFLFLNQICSVLKKLDYFLEMIITICYKIAALSVVSCYAKA